MIALEGTDQKKPEDMKKIFLNYYTVFSDNRRM